MPKYYVGDFIRETRERRGYTQEELCYGICSVPSLSRIENGVQVPGSRRLDALLQRLGCGDQVFNELVSKEETKIYECIIKIRQDLVERNYEELEVIIKQLEPMIKDRSEFDIQYFYFAQSRLMKYKGADLQEIMERYMKAIHITLPEFDGKKPLKNKLLTFDEITIINSIASLQAERGKYKEAIGLGY